MGSLEGETVNDNRARAGARIGARMAAWGLWRFSWAVWVANAERVRPLLPGMSGLVLGLAAGPLYVATPFVLAVWSRKDGNGFARTALEAAGGLLLSGIGLAVLGRKVGEVVAGALTAVTLGWLDTHPGIFNLLAFRLLGKTYVVSTPVLIALGLIAVLPEPVRGRPQGST